MRPTRRARCSSTRGRTDASEPCDANEEMDERVRPRTELARQLERSLRDLLWERCGVVREEGGRDDGFRGLEDVRASIADVEVRYIFFFQAEDGIRDLIVTGVQTCALPI